MSTIVAVDPPSGSDSMAVDIMIDRGGSRMVKVVDPDGKPAKGLTVSVRVKVAVKPEGDDPPLPRGLDGEIDEAASEFTVDAVGPKGRAIVIRQDAEKRVARLVIPGPEGPPITVKLEPWASVTGRVLDEAGQPRRGGVRLHWDYPEFTFEMDHDQPPDGLPLDANGRFLIEGLVPGAPYKLDFNRELERHPIAVDLTLKPGEARKLGDVRVKNGP